MLYAQYVKKNLNKNGQNKFFAVWSAEINLQKIAVKVIFFSFDKKFLLKIVGKVF